MEDIDIMVGVVRNEGSLPAQSWLPVGQVIDEKVFDELVLRTYDQFHSFDVNKVSEFYLNNVNRNDSDALRKAFYDLIGDIGITCPTYHFAKQFHSSYTNRKTYFYELTYQNTDYSMIPCNEKTMGICHAADLPFVFGTFLMSPNASAIDVQFSKDIMKMWTNFAKTGYEFYIVLSLSVLTTVCKVNKFTALKLSSNILLTSLFSFNFILVIQVIIGHK